MGERSAIPISEIRSDFADTVSRVAFGGDRVVLQRRGKEVAAIVPIGDLELIEQIENEIDLEELKTTRRSIKRSGTVSLKDVKAELDL